MSLSERAVPRNRNWAEQPVDPPTSAGWRDAGRCFRGGNVQGNVGTTNSLDKSNQKERCVQNRQIEKSGDGPAAIRKHCPRRVRGCTDHHFIYGRIHCPSVATVPGSTKQIPTAGSLAPTGGSYSRILSIRRVSRMEAAAAPLLRSVSTARSSTPQSARNDTHLRRRSWSSPCPRATRARLFARRFTRFALTPSSAPHHRSVVCVPVELTREPFQFPGPNVAFLARILDGLAVQSQPPR